VPGRSGGPAAPYTDAVTLGTAGPLPVAARSAVSPAATLLGQRAVLIPVKAFAEAKRRLGPALSDDARQALVRRMAERVVAAAAPLPVAVVCDDTEVADWARRRGALVVWEPGRGLNGAVEAGVARLADMGVESITVAHGDLPQAVGLGALPPFDGVTLVPDRRDDGTNVVSLPTGCGFRFSYGPGSFARHRAECDRIEMPVRILRAPSLTLDVDWPADLRWA
jgi:2-phospho-L-lactate/phosphoenolpyruvate guanylyltransferase